ncbi:hypothetical protein MICRO11B_290002 [Micrococcus luteus]|nr:hypothetical protein MICRO11B_290002 [Micrococcus luteus]
MNDCTSTTQPWPVSPSATEPLGSPRPPVSTRTTSPMITTSTERRMTRLVKPQPSTGRSGSSTSSSTTAWRTGRAGVVWAFAVWGWTAWLPSALMVISDLPSRPGRGAFRAPGRPSGCTSDVILGFSQPEGVMVTRPPGGDGSEDVSAAVGERGEELPDLVDALAGDLRGRHGLPLVGELGDGQRQRVHDHRVAHGAVRARVRRGHPHGVLHRAGLEQGAPVLHLVLAGEPRRGDHEHVRALHRETPGQLGEAQVVAGEQAQAEPAELDRRDAAVAGGDPVRLAVRERVVEVELAVRTQPGAVRAHRQQRVVGTPVRSRLVAARDDGDPVLPRQRGQARGERLPGRGDGVGELLPHLAGPEHGLLGQHQEVRPLARGAGGEAGHHGQVLLGVAHGPELSDADPHAPRVARPLPVAVSPGQRWGQPPRWKPGTTSARIGRRRPPPRIRAAPRGTSTPQEQTR